MSHIAQSYITQMSHIVTIRGVTMRDCQIPQISSYIFLYFLVFVYSIIRRSPIDMIDCFQRGRFAPESSKEVASLRKLGPNGDWLQVTKINLQIFHWQRKLLCKPNQLSSGASGFSPKFDFLTRRKCEEIKHHVNAIIISLEFETCKRRSVKLINKHGKHIFKCFECSSK